MVLGLIALLTSLILVNTDSMLKGLGEEPLPDVLKRAVREARYQAAYHKSVAYLSFDEEKAAFVISGANGQPIESLKTGYDPERDSVEVAFFQILPTRGTSFNFRRIDREKITAVRFHADRSSVPFEAEIRLDGNLSNHRFDPFSDSEIEVAP